ncbi:restriction endonuclease subunit S [Methylocaldum sp. BRCS4]|nr:restriction endonuclease subunit S [Methylocaldum sp. BRCS4]
MGEWRECSLGDLIELKRGYDLPQQRRLPGTVPIVSSSGITDFHSESMVTGPGVVTGRYGTLGQVFYIQDNFWPLNTTLYVRDFKGNDPRFISYFLKSIDFFAYSDKAAVPGLNRNDLHQARVLYPVKKTEQQAISSLLGALDDKIDLNRKINETLEAMARLFFKDWFVDFGPTHAKAEGHPPYLAPELWALFPDALDDEDKPVGWVPTRLGDIAEGVTRIVSPSQVEPETPYIGLEHMPRRSIALDSWEGAGKVTSGKLHFRSGEFLFGKLRPYFHKVGIAPVDGICSTDIVVCKPKQDTAYGLVLSILSSDEFVAYTDQTSTGTKMPRTSWSIMSRYEVMLPSEPILESFNNLLAPWIRLINANIHENRTLIQARDLLLPKLMSGEVRIREAENIVGAVA